MWRSAVGAVGCGAVIVTRRRPESSNPRHLSQFGGSDRLVPLGHVRAPTSPRAPTRRGMIWPNCHSPNSPTVNKRYDLK